MIDRRTGNICLGNAIVIGPGLIQSEFRSKYPGYCTDMSRKNDSSISYHLGSIPFSVNGEDLIKSACFTSQPLKIDVTLFFYGEKLYMVQQRLHDDADEACCPDGEALRKKFHDKLLWIDLGSCSYDFRWGEVASTSDRVTGRSMIIVRY